MLQNERANDFIGKGEPVFSSVKTKNPPVIMSHNEGKMPSNAFMSHNRSAQNFLALLCDIIEPLRIFWSFYAA